MKVNMISEEITREMMAAYTDGQKVALEIIIDTCKKLLENLKESKKEKIK